MKKSGTGHSMGCQSALPAPSGTLPLGRHPGRCHRPSSSRAGRSRSGLKVLDGDGGSGSRGRALRSAVCASARAHGRLGRARCAQRSRAQGAGRSPWRRPRVRRDGTQEVRAADPSRRFTHTEAAHLNRESACRRTDAHRRRPRASMRRSLEPLGDRRPSVAGHE